MILSGETYKRVIDNLHDGLYFVDRNRVITYWNRAAESISGFSAAEVVGKSCASDILTHIDSQGNNLCQGICPLAATMADRKSRESELFLHHKNGHRIPVSVRTSILTDSNGQVMGGIELFSDISNQEANRLRVRELEKMALLDSLTQLANRNYINREIISRMEEFKRFNISFGIVFMDIDHFKRFNDTYGHDLGDRVLRFVSDTFTANSRPFDLYGRWGGEEFVAIIRNISEKNLTELAERLRILVAGAYLKQGAQTLRISLSMGATIVRHNDTPDSILKRADSLMYQSKKAGRNRLTAG